MNPGVKIHNMERIDASVSGILVLGYLAASIGHELNNPLGYTTSSVGYCEQTLQELMQDESKHCEEAEGILEALSDASNGLERLHKVVRNLQRFTCLKDMEMRPLLLQGLLKSLVQRVQHEGIAVELRGDCEDVFIEGDSVVLMLALEHLVRNSHRALHRVSRGGESIRLSCECEDERVIVSVYDDGVGIAPEVKERIFEPFYKADPDHSGLGLGLTLTHQIVMAHRGQMYLWSEPGVGTQISVVLRRSTTMFGDELTAAESTVEDDAFRRFSILLVDEQEERREELARVLVAEFNVTRVGTDEEIEHALSQSEYGFDYVLYGVDKFSFSFERLSAMLRAWDASYDARLGVVVSGGLWLHQREELVNAEVLMFRYPLRAKQLVSSIYQRCIDEMR